VIIFLPIWTRTMHNSTTMHSKTMLCSLKCIKRCMYHSNVSLDLWIVDIFKTRKINITWYNVCVFFNGYDRIGTSSHSCIFLVHDTKQKMFLTSSHQVLYTVFFIIFLSFLITHIRIHVIKRYEMYKRRHCL
jgi:hypothetical protein